MLHLPQETHGCKHLANQSFIVTPRGTRPGSPLAHCVFHIFMAKVVHIINDWLPNHEPLQRVLQRVQIHVESIVWADGIAIPLATNEAAHLVDSIEHMLQFVHFLLAGQGFILNLQKGKASVVATFKGPGAPEIRKQCQLGSKPGISVNLVMRRPLSILSLTTSILAPYSNPRAPWIWKLRSSRLRMFRNH